MTSELGLSDRLRRPRRLTVPRFTLSDELKQAVESVQRRWPDVATLATEKDRERLLRKLTEHAARDDWRGIKVIDVARAGRAAFLEDMRSRDEFVHLRSFLLREIHHSRRPSFVSAMLGTYLETYDPGAQHTRELAAALKPAVQRVRLSKRWSTLIKAFDNLMDPSRAHLEIAEAMTAMPDPWAGLRNRGVVAPHGPGLMQASYSAWLARIESSLDRGDVAETLLHWLQPVPGKPALQMGAPLAIEALLRPWVHQDPPATLRDRLVSRLVDLYSDPRTGRRGPWAAVDRGLHARFLHWLAGANMRLFLDVISNVEDSHMWAPRRDFWLGLYEQGRISEAWVAFSDEGAREAQRLSIAEGNKVMEFGRQTQRQNTSLLLMRIGKAIVIEGSHNYKVHIFRSSDPQAPAFYRKSYDCEDIRRLPGSETQVHLGNWQERVRWKIEKAQR